MSSMFKAPKAPPPPPEPPPAPPAPDEAGNKQAMKQAYTKRRRSSGRTSTVMSDETVG